MTRMTRLLMRVERYTQSIASVNGASLVCKHPSVCDGRPGDGWASSVGCTMTSDGSRAAPTVVRDRPRDIVRARRTNRAAGGPATAARLASTPIRSGTADEQGRWRPSHGSTPGLDADPFGHGGRTAPLAAQPRQHAWPRRRSVRARRTNRPPVDRSVPGRQPRDPHREWDTAVTIRVHGGRDIRPPNRWANRPTRRGHSPGRLPEPLRGSGNLIAVP
jgi:hypothetical protein